MGKADNLLKEWLVRYIKNRDILLKQIESINENHKEWDLVVKTKKGLEKYYIVRGEITNFKEIEKRLSDETIILVVFNTKHNFDVILENWKKLINLPKLSILFVNPDSELEKKWVIFPHTHHKITEKSSLVKGLKTLFQTVEKWRG